MIRNENDGMGNRYVARSDMRGCGLCDGEVGAMTDEAKRCVESLRVRCRERDSCDGCPKDDYCHYHGDEALRDFAADLIESLASELERVKQERDGLNILLGQAQSMLETRTRERDAAVKDLKQADYDCKHCKFGRAPAPCEESDFVCADCKFTNCICRDCINNSHWQWCGVTGGNA